jgi:hypothetical protein
MTPATVHCLTPRRADAVAQQQDRVDRVLAVLRQVMTERGYTYDALAAATGQSRTYAAHIFAGDKRCTLEFLVSLPPDMLVAAFKRLAADEGLIVFEPAAVEKDAIHRFCEGLFKLAGIALPPVDQAQQRRERLAQAIALLQQLQEATRREDGRQAGVGELAGGAR